MIRAISLIALTFLSLIHFCRAAPADDSVADGRPSPAIAASEPPGGIQFDHDGIIFGSGMVLTVPATLGAAATEGPAAGSADHPESDAGLQEAVP